MRSDERMPWGAMAELRNGKNFLSCCPFTSLPYDERTMHWIDLIKNHGSFSENASKTTPLYFEVGENWISLLGNGTSWLHSLFRGTHALEVGDVNRARDSFKDSVSKHPNAHAYRGLAVISRSPTRAGNIIKCMELLHQSQIMMLKDSSRKGSCT